VDHGFAGSPGLPCANGFNGVPYFGAVVGLWAKADIHT